MNFQSGCKKQYVGYSLIRSTNISFLLLLMMMTGEVQRTGEVVFCISSLDSFIGSEGERI